MLADAAVIAPLQVAAAAQLLLLLPLNADTQPRHEYSRNVNDVKRVYHVQW
jgi:hypothetical protein